MIRTDMDDISDEDFDNVVLPCSRIITDYIKETFLDEFIAFNIATYYKNNALWDEPFDVQIHSAVEDLAQLSSSDCNKDKIKSILENNHHLKVVCESPIMIEELEDI